MSPGDEISLDGHRWTVVVVQGTAPSQTAVIRRKDRKHIIRRIPLPVSTEVASP